MIRRIIIIILAMMAVINLMKINAKKNDLPSKVEANKTKVESTYDVGTLIHKRSAYNNGG